jgi:hypothetical protein
MSITNLSYKFDDKNEYFLMLTLLSIEIKLFEADPADVSKHCTSLLEWQNSRCSPKWKEPRGVWNQKIRNEWFKENKRDRRRLANDTRIQ